MFPLEVYKGLREEQRELAGRIHRLSQFIDNHDNMGTNKELDDEYMDILRDQLESMKDYCSCLVMRIGIAVTEGVEHSPVSRRANSAVLRDVKKFREDLANDNKGCGDCDGCVCGKAMDNKPKHELGDKVNPDEIVSDEDAHNFFGFHVERWTDVL